MTSEPQIKVNVRIPPSHRDAAAKAAHETDCRPSDIFRQALKEWLQNYGYLNGPS